MSQSIRKICHHYWKVWLIIPPEFCLYFGEKGTKKKILLHNMKSIIRTPHSRPHRTDLPFKLYRLLNKLTHSLSHHFPFYNLKLIFISILHTTPPRHHECFECFSLWVCKMLHSIHFPVLIVTDMKFTLNPLPTSIHVNKLILINNISF